MTALSKPKVRPVDAAGLILLRDGAQGLEVLVGKRHPRSRFMPSVYVFPGGRLAGQDRRASGFLEDPAELPSGLDQATRRKAMTLARTALRETFEETGMLATSRDSGGVAQGLAGPAEPTWRAYRETGLAPPFGALRLVARAITPPSSPIRFHTRFFRLDGDAVAGAAKGDGELLDVHWAPLHALGRLPMSSVTLLVLREALAHRPGPGAASRRAALFTWVGPLYRPVYQQDPLPRESLT